MTRMMTGLAVAAAFGFAVSAGAQTTTTPPQTTTPPMTGTTSSQQTTTSSSHEKGREITVTGCLARGSDGAFRLNNARMDDGMNRSSTTTTTGTTGTTGSSTVGTTAAEPTTEAHGAAMSWKLEGGKDLERHIGHEIQVTGRTEWNEHAAASTTTTSSTASAATTTAGGARLDVSSIKMIASSCQ